MTLSVSNNDHHEFIRIPEPLLVVIEDVGWWSGYSYPEKNEPYRTGIGRMHVPADYAALIRLSKKLKTRIVCGFVLCEWDREGILSNCPSSTWMGREWKGCSTGTAYQKQTVSLLNENPDCISLALHGVGHEYWTNGIPGRSEFHDTECMMRHPDEINRHLTLFGKLLESSGIQAPFPRIFIPPALKHSFGNGNRGFQKILKEFGIRFVLTVFEKAKPYSPPLFPDITEECGVVLIERGLSPVSWDHVAADPLFSFAHPVLPLHWANILHHDPEKNIDVIDAWADFIQKGADENGFILFPDEMTAISQIVFNRLTRIIPGNNGAVLDLSDVRKIFSDHMNLGFHTYLPKTAVIDESDGILEHAGYIREGLMKIKPFPETGKIRIQW